MKQEIFKFKKFVIDQTSAAMKVGTDGVLLGAWAQTDGAKRILDIGAGTGLITIMMAQSSSEATCIDGVEIDESSFQIATKNIAACPWADRINIFHASIQDYTRTNQKQYDLIISNPPFFSGGTLSDSQNKIAVRHTTKLPHGDLLRSVKALLAPTGRFVLILPRIEGLRFSEMAQTYGLYCSKKTRVYPHPMRSIERLLLEFRMTSNQETLIQDIYIQEDGTRNNFTAEYKELTKDYYLNF